MSESTTHIPGKDEALESTLEKLGAIIQSLGFDLEEHHWLNPIEGVWSVNLRDKDCALLFTNGKGRSKKAALASAYGEYIERLSTNYFFADFYFGEEIANAGFVHYPNERWFESTEALHPELLADEKLREFYFPKQHGTPPKLVDFNSGNESRGICALPLLRVSNNKTYWFPVNVIANLYVSNGMSAGNNLYEARVQALSEILERAVKFRIISEQICLPNIPDTFIDKYPSIKKGIKQLRALGYGVLVKDASLGGVYPVANVTLLNHKDQGCYASFGAHPRFEIALESALTELLQDRALDTLRGFPQAEFDENEVASPQNIETHFIDSSGCISWKFLQSNSDIPFTEWEFASDSKAEYNKLCTIIHSMGHEIYVSDLEHLNTYACRIIVPGLSEIYPPDDLVWENNNEGLDFRERILNLNTLSVEQCQRLYDDFISRGYDDQHPIAQLIGVAPEPGSIWEELRIGELKTLLALRTQNAAATLDGCTWLQLFEQISDDRLSLYRCIASLLQMDTPVCYSESLILLFGELKFKLAQDLIMGKPVLPGFENHGLELVGFDQHKRLLSVLLKHRATMK